MVTKRGKQASRKAAARKYGFLEAPLIPNVCVLMRASLKIQVPRQDKAREKNLSAA
ncbi:MAG: hypothetical protein Q8K59_12950 [Nitrosomonas sp.]|nr:hypothetical protein [Nitrosomonas sp.]MDP1951967.1 hypothetical protein [Nitrosomonas sp.]